MQDLIGEVIGGTYRVERLIGKGGMGAVYAARHLRLPTAVAIKVLHMSAGPEALARFRREAETTSALRHPNIVQVLDFNTLPDGTPYLVMELLEGEDLQARLRRRGSLPLAEVLQLVAAVGSGLSAAHRREVVHRDLKPQNVFLARQGDGSEVPKIVDFGISKIHHDEHSLLQTRDDQLLGTPNYMSPEQARGKNSEVDARTDQWALAAIAYQCLSGRVAFAGSSLAEVVTQVLLYEPPSLREVAPTVPEPVAAVLHRALSKARDHRYPSIADFVAALTGGSEAQDAGPVQVIVAEPTRSRPGGQAPSRWLRGLGAALAVGAVIAGLAVGLPRLAARRGRQDRAAPAGACTGLAACAKACAEGDGAGCNNLGVIYDHGEGVPRDPGRAVTLYQKACDAGSATGCNGLGTSYAHAGDYVRAAALYRRACDGGEAQGCTNLGWCYESGSGVPRDEVRAVALYQQACEGGRAAGCANLGRAYIRGMGVPRDAARAFPLFQRACDGGDAQGCANLGVCYHTGEGVARDDARAVALFEQSCARDPGSGCGKLGTMAYNGFGMAQDRARALQLWQTACDAGEVSFCGDVGIKVYKGEGAARDLPRAFALFQKACDAGDAASCTNLGVMYQRGDAPAADPAHAIRLFQKACDAGNRLGCSNLEVLRRPGR